VALKRASAKTPAFFMHGNRDFLIGAGFARATGLKLLRDPARVDLYGTPALLMHGDTLCTDDREYQAFRAMVREPAWQRATLARPIAERLALAGELRERSEAAKEGKSMEIMDVTPATVDQAFAATGRSLLIHGHTHRPARHVHQVGGRECVRWVLPDWYESGGYLEATPGGIRAVTI
jgi:UDP-2,3-diacylglucosamine hydrolase